MQATKNTYDTRYEPIPQVKGMGHVKLIIQVMKYFNNHHVIDDPILHVRHHTLYYLDSPYP